MPQTLGDHDTEEMAEAMRDEVLDGSDTERARLTSISPPLGAIGGIGWWLIALDGQLDLCSSPLLGATLLASVSYLGLEGGVVVDLAQVEFIDSSGLDALLGCRDQLRASGMDLVVRHPSPLFVRILDILGHTDLAEQAGDRRECRFAC